MQKVSPYDGTHITHVTCDTLKPMWHIELKGNNRVYKNNKKYVSEL